MDPRPSFSGDTLAQLSRVARLPLDDQRTAAVGSALDLIYGLVDTLDDVELGETPPATAFDARWE